MVKIRLSRTGGKNSPFYRIVAVDERRKSNGRSLELLGTYDPRIAPEKLVIKTERVAAWEAKGAQLSPSVRSLMRRARRREPAVGAAR
jgi:small subunit ribosomal protein S16